jgi:hypothetical protein
MNKWRLRASSACFKGADVSFNRILIVVGGCTGGDDLVWGQNVFRICDILPCRARTKRLMNKWRLQPDSANQIGTETAFLLLLIVGQSGRTEGSYHH